MPLIGGRGYDSIKKNWFSGGGRDGWTDWFRQVHLSCHDGEWEPSKTKCSSWHHLWHFQQENKEQVPDQADPIQVIVEADVDSAQVGQVIYVHICFLVQVIYNVYYKHVCNLYNQSQVELGNVDRWCGTRLSTILVLLTCLKYERNQCNALFTVFIFSAFFATTSKKLLNVFAANILYQC